MNRLPPDKGNNAPDPDDDRPPEKAEMSSWLDKLKGVVPNEADEAALQAEEQASREEFAELGIVPVDPATLEKGPPLSAEDWQALYRYHRDPQNLTDEEVVRIGRLRRSFDTWAEADREVCLRVSEEEGLNHLHRN